MKSKWASSSRAECHPDEAHYDVPDAVPDAGRVPYCALLGYRHPDEVSGEGQVSSSLGAHRPDEVPDEGQASVLDAYRLDQVSDESQFGPAPDAYLIDEVPDQGQVTPT
jgi:hypothetical protein